jgi:Xaa-Pro aminopeptidase
VTDTIDHVGEFRSRLARSAALAADQDIDALLVTPGPDLFYLTGYNAVALERLTCLVVAADRDPFIVVPMLERSSTLASPIGELDIDIVSWTETENPYDLVNAMLGNLDETIGRVALDDRMWAAKVLALRSAMPHVEQVPGNSVMREMRIRKSNYEIAALQRAGAAIDSVHAQVSDLLRVGRTEAEIGKDLNTLIQADHERADFIIVGSGPNSSSPHAETSQRVLHPGDIVVVDIGGTTGEGYCSDSTRTYAMGEPDPEFVAAYEVLQRAQATAVAAVRPGVTCEALDAVARDILTDAGLGDLFVHRTGHGIGLESHEDPYLVEGNSMRLAPGMAFSIEPGFYVDRKWGARIEDIVVCSDNGAIVCNNRPRELAIVEG